VGTAFRFFVIFADVVGFVHFRRGLFCFFLPISAGRAQLYIASQCRTLDKRLRIICFEDIVKTFSKRGCP